MKSQRTFNVNSVRFQCDVNEPQLQKQPRSYCDANAKPMQLQGEAKAEPMQSHYEANAKRKRSQCKAIAEQKQRQYETIAKPMQSQTGIPREPKE